MTETSACIGQRTIQKALQDRAKEAYASRSTSRSVSPQKRQRTNDNGRVGEAEDRSLEEDDWGWEEEEEGLHTRGRKRRRRSSFSHVSQYYYFSNRFSDIPTPIPQPETPPSIHLDEADILRQQGLKRQREVNSDIIAPQEEDRLWSMKGAEGKGMGTDSGLFEELAEHGIQVIDDDNDNG